MRLWLAIRAFFRVLLDATVAEAVDQVLSGERQLGKAPAAQEPQPPHIPAQPVRNDALVLLDTLQREARFIDIVQEPLENYSDAQVGAAARDVLRDCRTVLDRLFALEPLVDKEEGADVEAPAGYDPGHYRLTGNVSGEPPFRGRLVHHGWQATRCDLPQWFGSKESARVVAPVELEVP